MYWPDVKVIKDHRVEVLDGFAIVFFMDASHAELISGIEQCLQQYVGLVDWASLPFYVTDDGDIDPINLETLEGVLLKRFHAQDAPQESGITLLGSDTDVSPFEFHYFGAPLPVTRWPDYRNLLYCWLPKDLVLKRGFDAMETFVSSMAAHLPFSFAYANPALLYDREFGEATPRAKRYLGFDVLKVDSIAMELGDRAAGVYWLTLLGRKLTDRLGGVATLRACLPSSIAVREVLPGKALIRLGAEPEVGDVNRQTEFPLHRELARVLEPVLHMPIRNYFANRDNESDPEAMLEWHRRFL
jgi:hypothetical protein